MLNSRQRSQLRAMAHDYEPLFQIGKGGVSDNVIRQADEALTARELIKLSVLKTYEGDARSACDEICAATGADPVQCIGRRFVLYRPSPDKPSIRLVR